MVIILCIDAFPNSIRTAYVIRNKPDNVREYICSVKYYISKDTIFVNHKFGFFGIMYKINKNTDNINLIQKSIPFCRKKNNWYFLILDKEKLRKPINSKIHKIYFGNYAESKNERFTADAVLHKFPISIIK